MSFPPTSNWPAMLASWLESPAGPPSESEVEGLVAEILDYGWAAPEAAFRVAIRVLRRDSAMARALAAAARRDLDAIDAAVQAPAFAAALARPLATAVLRRCLVTEPDVELALTRWRRWLILEVARGATLSVPLEAVISLALQCWLNEFVFDETRDERSALAALPPPTTPLATAVLAAFGPLAESQLAASSLATLIEAHVAHPQDERSLSTAIADLNPVVDPTSLAVRAQYEANPYPRWLTCQRERPRRFGEFLSAIGQGYGISLPPAGHRPEILIAGCGTGQQAIQCASQFPEARITGLDLSRPSLAYAARQAHALKVDNVTWTAGDLLQLPPVWHERFQYIECLGVLHHLASPAEGLAALTRCLKPGGLVYLGLYSATARRAIAAARELIDKEKLSPDASGIRRFRKRVFDLAARRGPKADRLKPILGFMDFFSTSMCRDLAFHVQEHQFKPAGIASLAATAGLDLLGFGISDSALAGAYAHANPNDAMIRDPARIEAFERKNPNAFAAMYLCLAHKPIK